jgi:hypothetical protein
LKRDLKKGIASTVMLNWLGQKSAEIESEDDFQNLGYCDHSYACDDIVSRLAPEGSPNPNVSPSKDSAASTRASFPVSKNEGWNFSLVIGNYNYASSDYSPLVSVQEDFTSIVEVLGNKHHYLYLYLYKSAKLTMGLQG